MKHQPRFWRYCSTIALAFGLSIMTIPGWAQQNDVSPKAVERLQKEVRHELALLPILTVFDNLAF
jgi:hypothetical protein